jgi:RsiW-degrading membrane proteinase PrsW (M82 family)
LSADSSFALALVIVVALVYLLVLRLVDMNEKEPLWALALCLGLGGVAAALSIAIVGGAFQSTAIGDALTDEVAKFAAMLAVLAIFNGVAGLRGWSEINGVMDGVVYGAAIGLGFAVGEAFVYQLTFGGSAIAASPSGWTALWTTVLHGLRHGLFGAVLGAGFGAAANARTDGQRVLYPIVGLIAAIVVHAAHSWIATGQAAGDQGEARYWIGLLIPIVIVLGLMISSLGKERKTIRAELDDEVASGVVTQSDLALLESTGRRRSAYLAHLGKGDFDGWQALRTLQNRQVQLALAKKRAAAATDLDQKARAEMEVERLRASVVALRSAVPAGTTAGKVGA